MLLRDLEVGNKSLIEPVVVSLKIYNGIKIKKQEIKIKEMRTRK